MYFPEWDDKTDEQEKEFGVGIVPNVYTEFNITQALYINLKAGFGPSFKMGPGDDRIYHSGNSINLSLSCNIYP